MKKMIISMIACMALVLGSLVAFELYIDWLAALLFLLAFIPSCLFEEGRKEYNALKDDHHA